MNAIQSGIVAALGEFVSSARLAGVTPDTRLIGGFAELDSMALTEFVVMLETAFEITFPDEDLNERTFRTIGSLAAYIEERSDGAP